MTRQTTVIEISIQLLLAVLWLTTVQANLQNYGQQTFEARAPQYAQKYKEVIMYLTPTQIKNYEAGHGLPNFPAATSSHPYEQQETEQETPLNEEEGQIIQSTLNILEANKMKFQQQKQSNNADLDVSKAQEYQNEDVRPIEEPEVEERPAQHQFLIKSQQQNQNKLEEQFNKEQEQVAKSYAYIHFFSNKKPDNPEKIQIFHPEPQSVNLDEEIRLQKERNIEIQQDPLLRQKFRLIPYEYVAEENQEIKHQAREQLSKQEKQSQVQLFKPALSQLQAFKERENQQNDAYLQQQYAPQFTSHNNNIDLGKIIQEIQLEREAARSHSEVIAKSPAVVIHKDISIIRRRPIHVTKHVNVPYPAPFFVPVPNPIEVKVPQPYAVPLEIIRHVPVPVIKTEAVEVEKPVPYEVEKHVPEIVEKKVYVSVEKPFTVERFVPIEVKKEIPVEIPIHRPEKYTIIRHVWKH